MRSDLWFTATLGLKGKVGPSDEIIGGRSPRLKTSSDSLTVWRELYKSGRIKFADVHVFGVTPVQKPKNHS